MATDEQKKEIQANGPELQERKRIENPSEVLQKSLNEGLSKYGGFQLLKGLIKGVENMDPRRKAVKNIFLSDAAYADARLKLKNELELWVSILENGGTDPMAIIDSCKANCQKAEQNLETNLFNIHEEIKQLEITYRTLDAFFANAGQGKIVCLTLMTVNKARVPGRLTLHSMTMSSMVKIRFLPMRLIGFMPPPARATKPSASVMGKFMQSVL